MTFKLSVYGIPVKKAEGGEGSVSSGGKASKAFTIVNILYFVLFFALTEIAVFKFKDFFVSCFGGKAWGFGPNFLIFLVGGGITYLLMRHERNKLGIFTVVLILVLSIMVPLLVYPYCQGALKYVGGTGSYLICSIKSMTDPSKCLAPTNTTAPPPVKVIYQFEPIQIRFGSKYTKPTPFTPPTLYANDKDGYNLLITVTNPNTENELTVDGFYLRSYFAESGENNNSDMFSSNNKKMMCGKAAICNETNPCSLAPGSDTEISLTFNDTGNCTSASNLTVSISEDACKTQLINSCNETRDAKNIDNIVGCSKQSESCLKDLCREKCAEQYPYLTFAGVDNKTSRQCVCIRNVNNVTDLCYDYAFGSEVRIRFYAAHNFSVLGIGELRVAETETFLNFEPVVFSSAGPLVVTVYFDPHAILSDETRDILMYVNLKNDGYGSIHINDINIKQFKDKIGFDDTDISACIKDTADRIKLVNSEKPLNLSVG